MKKNIFFGIFLTLFSFCMFWAPQTVFAESPLDSLEISAQVKDALGNFSTLENCGATFESVGENNWLFKADYSSITDITFSTSFVSGLTYSWFNANNELLTPASALFLNKKPSTYNNLMILIGESKFVLNVEDENGETKKIVFTVKISDNSKECSLITWIPHIPDQISATSQPLEFSAILPISTNSVVTWYLKAPNSASFSIVEQNSNSFIFDPQKNITSQNGYGTYKIMIIAYNKNTKTYYYSDTYEIKTAEQSNQIISSNHKILKNIIKNRKAEIEAFEFYVENSAILNKNKICWYLTTNGVKSKISTGEKFIYEPTSTENFTVTVEYINPNGTITMLGNITETPNITNTWQLILFLVVSVVVLSGILAISIIVTNKKRDVVW